MGGLLIIVAASLPTTFFGRFSLSLSRSRVTTSRRPLSPLSPCWCVFRRGSSRSAGYRLAEQWAAGHEVDRAKALGDTYTWVVQQCPSVLVIPVWAALLLVVVGAIAGASGSRLVQYGIVGAAVELAWR